MERKYTETGYADALAGKMGELRELVALVCDEVVKEQDAFPENVGENTASVLRDLKNTLGHAEESIDQLNGLHYANLGEIIARVDEQNQLL